MFNFGRNPFGKTPKQLPAPAAKKPDYRDGRDFDPIDVRDGNIRLLLTADTKNPLPDGTAPVHVDGWNLAGVTGDPVLFWARASELLTIAQRIANENHAEALRGARGRN